MNHKQPVMTDPGDDRQRFFVRHTSGDIFAVETLQYEIVLGTCGPLPPHEVRSNLLDEYEYTTEDNEWFMDSWALDEPFSGPLMEDDPVFQAGQ